MLRPRHSAPLRAASPPLSFLLRSARTFSAADDAQPALVAAGGIGTQRPATNGLRGEQSRKSHGEPRQRYAAAEPAVLPAVRPGQLRDGSVGSSVGRHGGTARCGRNAAPRSGSDRPVPSAAPRFRGDQVTAAAGRERLCGSPRAPVSTGGRVDGSGFGSGFGFGPGWRPGGGGSRSRAAAAPEREDRAGSSPGRPGRPEPFAAVVTDRDGGRLGSLGPRAGVGSAGWVRHGFRSAPPGPRRRPFCPTSGPAAVPGPRPPDGARWRSSVLPRPRPEPAAQHRWPLPPGCGQGRRTAAECLLSLPRAYRTAAPFLFSHVALLTRSACLQIVRCFT